MTNLLTLLLVSSASAQPCPDAGVLVRRAWSAYQLAEIAAAQGDVRLAYASLECHRRVVGNDELLQLGRLDGLVALSRGDARAMELAIRRSIAVRHDTAARPPDEHGPKLKRLWDTIVDQTPIVTIGAEGGGTVWVDGRAIPSGSSLSVAAGLHLVQIEGGDRLSGRVMTVEADRVIQTGLGGAEPVAEQHPVPLVPVELELPPPPPPTPALPQPPVAARDRLRPLGLWLVTLGVGSASVLAIGSGFRTERSFLASPYVAEAFGDCAYGDPCYPDARHNAIVSDAQRANTAYGLGYGLAAAAGGLLALTTVGLPLPQGAQH